MAENMFLYWGSGSVPCWKAMIALEEKGFSGYKNKLISFDNNEMKGEDVLKLNPRGEVRDPELYIYSTHIITAKTLYACSMQ